MMHSQPEQKYCRQPVMVLADRHWPSRTITRPPVWLSSDLRDGNQALFEPMDIARKLKLFQELCRIGFKEIEVAFPAASQVDYDFVRLLIEGGHIPPDVTIAVLTQAREPLIRRTMAALRGARRAIAHVYNATSPVFRDVVFGLDRQGVIDMAVDAVRMIRSLTDQTTEWVLEYSPETFTATEPEFALAICNAVTQAWPATPDSPVILNLPATVECTTPNVYADQIEWMHRHLERRDSVILSVHPHNDRGTAVAAAELALLAGAQRVEGCLFGNGERTGNVDLVTLALNMYSQGIHPGLDFSDIDRTIGVCEEVTDLPVGPRHPYAGELVFTAFSGSHQDAIRKGMLQRQQDLNLAVGSGLDAGSVPWQIPYLPVDPADLGRSHASLIRVNSQSGKAGMAWVLETSHGVVLSRSQQVRFAAEVQKDLDTRERELTGDALWQIYCRTTDAGADAPAGAVPE